MSEHPTRMDNLAGMLERAQELGRTIGQTEEFRALKRAQERISDDRDVVRLSNRLEELEEVIARSLEKGEEPTEEVRRDYESAFAELQASPVYQALVAAQANMDKVLARVNQEIRKGMDAGAQSRIILPS